MFNEARGVWILQGAELESFRDVLNEPNEEDDDPTAKFGDGKAQTFGDVLEQQYQYDRSEWWNDPLVMACRYKFKESNVSPSRHQRAACTTGSCY